jgi:beta-phosphoglucomutase-like phosphatase (HAD superfamily)
MEPSARLERQFVLARPFAAAGSDFFYTLRYLQEHPGADFGQMTEERYEQIKEKSRGEDFREFFRMFYAVRREEQQKDPEQWCRLNRAHRDVLDLFLLLSRRLPVLIGTAKDRESVLLIMKQHGIAVRPRQVVSKEFSTSKTAQAESIAGQFGVRLQEILFVEDMFRNARALKALGVQVVMTAWGYNTRTQREAARKAGISVIDKHTMRENIEGMVA